MKGRSILSASSGYGKTLVLEGHGYLAAASFSPEGYGLQAVRKGFAMNSAFAAEGTHFIPLPTFSAACLDGS
jgi:hypothetical protein